MSLTLMIPWQIFVNHRDSHTYFDNTIFKSVPGNLVYTNIQNTNEWSEKGDLYIYAVLFSRGPLITCNHFIIELNTYFTATVNL